MVWIGSAPGHLRSMWLKTSIHIFILQGIFVWVYIIWPPLSRWLHERHARSGSAGLDEEIERLKRRSSRPRRESFKRARQRFDERVHKTFQEQARARARTRRTSSGYHEEKARPTSPPVSSERRRHLRTLGLHPSADARDIRFAYRDLAKQNHPDRFAAVYFSDEDRAKADKRMREINTAYQWLTENEAA